MSRREAYHIGTPDKRNRIRRLFFGIGWILPALLAIGGQRLLVRFPEFTEQIVAERLFRWISRPIAAITSLFPFSLTELLALCALPLAAFLLVRLIRSVRRAERHLRTTRVGRALLKLLWTASLLLLVFMLLHGWNYARQPVAVSFAIPVQERSVDELAAGTAFLAEQAAQARATLPENTNGALRLSQSVQETLKMAWKGYEAASADYPLLAHARIRPKSVLLSHSWSYTGIAGMYFPFLVESNVNTDVPASTMPATALHEIAHTIGFAREDEAGFLAFLTGTYHPSGDFRYSALLDAYISLSGRLYGYDPEAWAEAEALLSDAVRRDLGAINSYWKSFEGPVRDVSSTINDQYLKANLQEDGVRSYGRKVDLILGWLQENGALS